MGIFNISIVNRAFESRNEHECADFADARDLAIKGALAIGAAEVTDSNPLFGAEVCIAQEGERLARYVVAIAISPLNK